jgi:sodium transport system permease protein
MRGILTVFRKEFFENLRDRRILLSALVFGPVFGPVMLMLLLQFMVSQGESATEKPLTITVVGAQYAPNLMATLEAQNIKAERKSLDETQIRAAIQQRQATVVLRIPEEFAARWADSKPAALQLFADGSDQFGGQTDARRVSRAVENWGRQVGQQRLLLRGVDPTSTVAIAVQDVDVSTPVSRAAFTLGMMSYLVIFALLLGGMYLAIDSTAGERERGSLESLLTAPMPRRHLIYGKILATTTYMLISLTLTVVGCAVMLQYARLEEFGMSVSMGPLVSLQLIGVAAPMALFGAGLLTVIASFTRSFREAQSYLSFAISVPTLPLAFVGLMRIDPSPLIYAMPSLSQHFLMMQVLRGEVPAVGNVLMSAASSLLLGLALCWFAGKLYEREAILG